MTTYLYRCKARIKRGQSKGKQCGARRALAHPIGWYKRPPKCLACGAPLSFVDRWQRKRNRENTCKCDGAHYPHRRGSTPLCIDKGSAYRYPNRDDQHNYE